MQKIWNPVLKRAEYFPQWNIPVSADEYIGWHRRDNACMPDTHKQIEAEKD